MTDTIKIGLALGGGFFRGFAHVGVLQVLHEHNIPIHCVSGTSIGSAVGALFACGMDVYRMEKIIYSLNEKMLYDIGNIRDGVIRGKKIHDLIHTLTGGRTFAQTKIPFACVACDIETGEMVVMDEGPLADGVRASTAVPGVFQPFKKNGRILVDGGVVDRLPSTLARQLGADVVIAVDVGVRDGHYKVHNAADVVMRALELMEYRTMVANDCADLVLAPELRHINMVTLSQSEECVAIGRKVAEDNIDKIKEVIKKAAEKAAAPEAV